MKKGGNTIEELMRLEDKMKQEENTKEELMR
jgi:hypothetical protein